MDIVGWKRKPDSAVARVMNISYCFRIKIDPSSVKESPAPGILPGIAGRRAVILSSHEVPALSVWVVSCGRNLAFLPATRASVTLTLLDVLTRQNAVFSRQIFVALPHPMGLHGRLLLERKRAKILSGSEP